MAGTDPNDERHTSTTLVGAAVTLAVVGAMTGMVPAYGTPGTAGRDRPPRQVAAITAGPSSKASPSSSSNGSPSSSSNPSPSSSRSGACPAVTGGPVTRAPGAGRTVALTFDDGPGDATAAVLDLLRRRGVQATFFVIGAAASARPDLVARAAAEGHLVGDHTWYHQMPREVVGGWTRTYLRRELTRTDRLVAAATGRPVCWFRPPGGFLPSSVLPVAHDLGLRVALWSVDPRDWALQAVDAAAGLTTAQLSDRIVARVSAGLSQQHPLILLHDGGGRRDATVAAIGRIIDLYRAHGYRFVRLDNPHA
jgi:peptidoglycan-N-acetylglucosamine deacetylase